MPRLVPTLVLLAIAGLFACLKPAPTVEPVGGGAEVPAGAVDPGPDPAADGGVTPADGGAETPSAVTCLSDADCDGGVCEGQGCDGDEPGTCAPKSRMCTRDSRAYCGCDGQTFRASGSCPGRRYAAEGECGTAGSGRPDAKAP
jgi:hypothetical protein